MRRHLLLRAAVMLLAAKTFAFGMTGVAQADPGLSVSDLNHGVTATDLANALVGSGVTISNVTYTGDTRAAGKFSGGATIVGFDSGITLGSGKAQTVAGDPTCSSGVEGPNDCHEPPNAPPSGTANSTAFSTAGDADLTALSGFPTFDAAVLEFDFVPQFSTVQFTYVFSSEEYSDFANTQFNDVFGFFVNGTNCALVPGTNEPVAVNTINNGNDVGGNPTPHHPELFRDNVRPTVTIDTQLDGLTVILTCNATVTPGQTNHMKLAIADASDRILDSSVFIKSASLISGTVITTSLTGGGQSGGAITVPQGTPVTDSATLAGANAASAGGTVSYTVFSDATCQTPFANAGTKTVTNGQVPNSDPVTFNQAGTFYWQASYSGDALNNAASSTCGTETVTVAQQQCPECTALNPSTLTCEPVANETPCTGDGFSCTSDTCQNGTCTHTPNNAGCANGDECTTGVCDPSAPGHDAAGCVVTSATDGTPCSDDGFSCTSDACQNGTCVHAPDNILCNDSLVCTIDLCNPTAPGHDAAGCIHPFFNPAPPECGGPPVVNQIPTLSEWGMLLFVVLLLGIACVTLVRRRNASAR